MHQTKGEEEWVAEGVMSGISLYMNIKFIIRNLQIEMDAVKTKVFLIS